MKIAIMSDIHSNYEAFQSCINETEKREIQHYIFLGDYLGDMAYPQKTLKLIKELQQKYNCTLIRGNKEEYWICHRQRKDEIWKSGSTETGMLHYNYENITEQDIDFFECMPISKTIHYPGYPDFVVCHGSPFKVNQSMRPDYPYIKELTSKLSTELTICGHFHIQTDYTKNGKRILNPGSIGVPLYSPGKAQFLILNGRNGLWETEFLSIPYSVEQTIKEMEEEKLPEKAPGWSKITKHLLYTGNVSHASVFKKAAELYYQDSGIQVKKGIPEKYWELAISELLSQ